MIRLPADLSGKVKNERLRLEDVLDVEPPWQTWNETWLSEQELLYLDADASLMVYDLDTKWKSILASNQSLVRSGRLAGLAGKPFQVSLFRNLA